jgi:triphosphatase
LRRSLRKLSPKLGAARDWDVLAQRLSAARAPGLLAQAKVQRDKARQTARRAIESKAFARLLAESRAIAAAGSTQGLAQFGAAALERAHRKLLKLGKIDWNDAAGRHALRIRLKRLRYSCEFFAAAFPARQASPYIGALKELQEVLGELNDIEVGRRLLDFDADEAALLRTLETVWPRFLDRPPFWRAPARRLRRAAK